MVQSAVRHRQVRLRVYLGVVDLDFAWAGFLWGDLYVTSVSSGSTGSLPRYGPMHRRHHRFRMQGTAEEGGRNDRLAPHQRLAYVVWLANLDLVYKKPQWAGLRYPALAGPQKRCGAAGIAVLIPMLRIPPGQFQRVFLRLATLSAGGVIGCRVEGCERLGMALLCLLGYRTYHSCSSLCVRR